MLRAAVTVAAAVRRLPRRGAVEVFAATVRPYRRGPAVWRDYLSPPLLRALEAHREHFGHVRVLGRFEVPEGDRIVRSGADRKPWSCAPWHVQRSVRMTLTAVSP